MRFEFATATRIIFGPGTLSEAGSLSREQGNKPLVVTGRHSARAEPLLQGLAAAGSEAVTFSVSGEPNAATVRAGAAAGRTAGCDHVVALGGGAAIDAARAIAAMMANEGDLLDYLEIIGKGRTLPLPPVPFIAIPTTAGTGAEVARNAVITSPDDKVKVSLRSPLLLARAVIVDPELTYSLPPALTATTGMDALTQLVEPFVSLRANPLTDGLCREGLTRVGRALRRAYRDGADRPAREDMSLASLFGGLALSNAGLGAVHGIAAPLGGMFPAPHGAVCAALLPHAVAVNGRALRERAPGSPALARYAEAAALLNGTACAKGGRAADTAGAAGAAAASTGTAGAAAEAAGAVEGLALWLQTLAQDLGIPRLSAHGVTEEHLDELAEKASRASSMKGNPIVLTLGEIKEIVRAAL